MCPNDHCYFGSWGLIDWTINCRSLSHFMMCTLEWLGKFNLCVWRIVSHIGRYQINFHVWMLPRADPRISDSLIFLSLFFHVYSRYATREQKNLHLSCFFMFLDCAFTVHMCLRASLFLHAPQVYSSLDLSRGHLEEKGEPEEKKSESPLTVDSLSWTPEFTEMYSALLTWMMIIARAHKTSA